MKVVKEQIEKVKLQFHNAVELKQSCKIYVTTTNNESWSFYFKKGGLIWASSSIHRFRRLYRLTNQICPEINCQNTRLREQEISELWEYLLVAVLYKRQQISIIQVKEIIQELIKEVLFDCLLRGEHIAQVKVIFETQGNGMGAILRSPLFKQPIAQINYKNTINRLESDVIDWQAINLRNYTPNFAPVIKDIQKLKKAVDSTTYQKLFIHINGKKTLRDIALASQQNLLDLARMFAPHIKSRVILMQQVKDQELTHLYFTPRDSNCAVENHHTRREYIQELDLPLVIYVDDNPHSCQYAAQVLNPLGYRLLPVNDAAKTLVVLLENKPSLVFLNAVMPDANGYELCAQVRKMPDGKNIPIIIAREQENMIDVVRAKMAGVSDFINKPIEAAELQTLAQKHTQDFGDCSVA
ncbi:MAG: response regulator [Cyanobacteria bacterium P01_G01_bin.39]